MSHLELVIESDLANISLIAVAMNSICIHVGLNAVQASNVELCIVEAITNAIKHAYHGEPERTISVIVSPYHHRLDIEVRDGGVAMLPCHAARLMHGSSGDNIEKIDRLSLPESGRGLQIIRDVMDEVVYVRKDNQNHLLLTKYLQPNPPLQ